MHRAPRRREEFDGPVSRLRSGASCEVGPFRRSASTTSATSRTERSVSSTAHWASDRPMPSTDRKDPSDVPVRGFRIMPDSFRIRSLRATLLKPRCSSGYLGADVSAVTITIAMFAYHLVVAVRIAYSRPGPAATSRESIERAGSRPRRRNSGERHVDDVFGNKPYLQLVNPNDVAHDQVVRSVVAVLRCDASHRSRFLQHDFVGV